ncbi:spinster family MFS transporter [Sphingomonas bacterium]|uniref:spinster family MFS transporter n=1 Tax=Sphingomonas bacterium TaxID=1895847 RepID=UPI001576DF31|nr:MFS transporter [Sphingomonas bacterium]
MARQLTVVAPAGTGAGARAYPWYMLALFVVANSFNTIDRVAMNLLIEPIRREFGFGDLQVGVIAGFGFAAFHALFGIPIARRADRGNRRNLLGLGVLLWSGMTVLTGRAGSFLSMLAIRVGVGVGEATCYPTAVPMIGDVFGKSQRSAALAIFQTGAFIGVVGGSAVVGLIAASHGWRAVFTALGMPGLVLALLIVLTVREPPRGAASDAADATLASGSYRQAWTLLRSNRRFGLLFVAVALMWTGASALIIWGPPFLMRLHGVGAREVGTVVGPITGGAGLIGTLVGGALSARLVKRSGDPRAPLRLVTLGALLATPATLVFVFSSSLAVALAGGAVAVFFNGIACGPILAAAIVLVPSDQRGLASSLIVVFAQQLLGLGISPLIVGLASDAGAASLGDQSLRWAMLIPCVALAGGWIAARAAARDTGLIEKAHA